MIREYIMHLVDEYGAYSWLKVLAFCIIGGSAALNTLSMENQLIKTQYMFVLLVVLNIWRHLGFNKDTDEAVEEAYFYFVIGSFGIWAMGYNTFFRYVLAPVVLILAIRYEMAVIIGVQDSYKEWRESF